MRSMMRAWGVVPLLAGVLGCASTKDAPTKAQITENVTAQATVLAVDKATREVTLQDSDGSRWILVCGRDVRNFDRINAGDKVQAHYTVSVTARRLSADEPDTAPTLAVAAARAAPGELPAGALGAGAAMTVVVKSVDKAKHIVTFTDPGGALHAVQAERDEGKRFVEGLKPGDRVELVCGESFALSVDRG
jgi:ribosomal protein S1